MRIIALSHATGKLRLQVDTFDDMPVLERLIFSGDRVGAISERRFKPADGSEGEMKKVYITVLVDKTQLDKEAQRLRINGTIVEAKPAKYASLRSYHTLNIAAGAELSITKGEWRPYMLAMLKNAERNSRKPHLGIIVIDDEKAQPAYLLGHGVEFGKEMRSGLSKRMKAKEYGEAKRGYFDEVISVANNMRVDMVLVAGPGFTKDELLEYAHSSGKRLSKQVSSAAASSAERSAVYEIISSESTAKLLERERMRAEFKLLSEFLSGIATGRSHSGIDDVARAVERREARLLLVNDTVLGNGEVKELLAKAEGMGVAIEVFNGDDDAGMQLHGFSDIASMA